MGGNEEALRSLRRPHVMIQHDGQVDEYRKSSSHRCVRGDPLRKAHNRGVKDSQQRRLWDNTI